MHLYFNSDDEDEAVSARAVSNSHAGTSQQGLVQHAPPQFAGSGCRHASKAGSVRVDYDTRDQCYVFKVLMSQDHATAIASLSNQSLKVYGVQQSQLTHTADLRGHRGTITDVQFPLSDCPYAVYSSSADNTVRGWDLRSGQQAQSFQAAGHELLCFSLADNLVVAGGQGDVLFWDRRSSKQLAAFTDTHMDDVTQVRLHSSSRKILSASQDGLIAVFDLAAGLDEDDGFISALNVNTSVEEMHFYGQQGERLWVRTGTEGLHLWEWQKASSDDMQGGDIAFADLPAARDAAQQAAAGSSAAQLFPQVDYLVGCHYDEGSGQLLLVAGTSEGTVGFWPTLEHQAAAGQLPAGANLLLAPVVCLHGGHSDVVRSVQVLQANPAGLFCVTGGEDAKLGLWSLQQGAGGASSSGPSVGRSHDSQGPVRSGGNGQRRRTPY